MPRERKGEIMPVLLRLSSTRVLPRSYFVVLWLTTDAEGVTDATELESVPEQSGASVSQNFKSLPIYPTR